MCFEFQLILLQLTFFPISTRFFKKKIHIFLKNNLRKAVFLYLEITSDSANIHYQNLKQ